MSHLQSVGILRANWYHKGKITIINYGTAFALTNRLLLTCTHNVYSEKKRFHAQEIFFLPGVSSGNAPNAVKFRVCSVKSHELPLQSYHRPIREELALLVLQQRLEATKFFKIGDWTPKEGKNMKTVGYPSLKCYKQTNIDKVHLTRNQSFGRLFRFEADSNIISYTMRTGVGFSGSPVLVRREDWEYVVVGLHTHRGLQRGFNSGLMLRGQVLQNLREWIREMQERWELPRSDVFEGQQKLSENKSCITDVSEFEKIERQLWDQFQGADGLKFLCGQKEIPSVCSDFQFLNESIISEYDGLLDDLDSTIQDFHFTSEVDE